MDIKPDNLVFNGEYQLALIDLGHTEKIDSTIDHSTGTPMYRPTEIEEGGAYEVAPADIYCLAVTILVIMIQDLPFAKMNRDTLNFIYSRSDSCDRFFKRLYSSFRPFDERHP